MANRFWKFEAGTVLASEGQGAFAEALSTPKPDAADAWVWLAYDQLNVAFLEAMDGPPKMGVVLIESAQKAQQRPYHQQKLGVLLSNQRHFALELQALGYPVAYVLSRASYSEVIVQLHESLGELHAFRHAERTLRLEVEPLEQLGLVHIQEHPGWMTSREWFLQSVGETPPFRMDAFYRTVRQETGWLMENGKPVGGKYSFDAENRQPWKGEPPAPEPPMFTYDAIDREVEALVRSTFHHHPGTVNLQTLPTSRSDVEGALAFAAQVLHHFGPFEDAMSEHSRGLFHSRLATLVNLHRLMPQEVVAMALASDAPLNCVEGFVRQMMWREYVRHVHEVTDGFRSLNLHREHAVREGVWATPNDEELHPNHLRQRHVLPAAYWGTACGLRCLDASVTSVMEDGWTHHIPRLMVLSNIANLLDVDPRALTDWFHAAFVDAYDWVVEPNVLGMGTFALGNAMMTKPYVAGAAYINKMSDHCKSCRFDPKKNCPITRLYWAYLERHSPSFAGNHRMAIAMKNVSRRAEQEKEVDLHTYQRVLKALLAGEEVRLDGEGDLRSWS